MDSAPIPVETLLAHREWVRAVAVAVVRDPNAADDVEQETWLAALRTPPRDERSLRGWFGAVARSRARRIGRTDARRDARETVAARRGMSPAAAELAELADTHRRVVQAVVDLPEPYRETILLRYFEGLAVEDVATRTSVPLDTARSRISRGLAKLRERLSRELGTDDRPWALALAPLIAAPKGSGGGAAAAGGGVVMASTKTMAAVAGALLLVAGIGAVVVPKWTSSGEKPVAAAPVETPAPPAPKPDEAKPVAPPPAVKRPRVVEDPAPAPAAETPNPTEPGQTVGQRLARTMVSGKWTNVPIPDVLAEIAAKSGVEIAVSSEANALWGPQRPGTSMDMEFDGSAANQVLELITQMKGLAWVIEGPRVVIVPKGVTRDPTKPVVALPPWTPPTPITVLGRVIDASGAAVAGAEIVQVQFGAKVVATTDVAGRYEVKLTPPYGSLEANAAGHLPSVAVSVDGRPGEQVTLDLATRGAAGSLTVRATSEDGPLAGVIVVIGPKQDVGAALPDNRPAVLRARRELTDAQGVASFPGVVGDDVVVSATKRHYEPVERKVSVEPGKTLEVDLRIVKAPPLEERLASKHVTFNFTNAHPAEVVSFINQEAALNVVIDPAFAMTLRERSVTLSSANLTLADALRALCTEIGATYKVREEQDLVWISAAKR